ncbi:MAG: DUF3135 domain-containing protein [Gammaproteobacteria bacterium]|nr:DUF3135 domain-containing protein [Gammaproteobacteria bacterium]
MKNRSTPTIAPKTVDELLALASSDPDALEAYRRAQVQSIIDNAPSELRQRLRGLQFTIDARRELHTSALGACIELSQLMLDSYSELQALLNQLGGQASTSEPAEPPATILAFPARTTGPAQPDPAETDPPTDK